MPADCFSAPASRLPVVDSDTITVTYESAFKLMADLRGMGETKRV